MIDENAPHRLRGQRVELLAVLELEAVLAHQAKPGFVHERGRLQRVAAPLAPEVRVRNLSQLGVDDGHQGVERGAVATGPAREELGHVAAAVRHGDWAAV